MREKEINKIVDKIGLAYVERCMDEAEIKANLGIDASNAEINKVRESTKQNLIKAYGEDLIKKASDSSLSFRERRNAKKDAQPFIEDLKELNKKENIERIKKGEKSQPFTSPIDKEIKRQKEEKKRLRDKPSDLAKAKRIIQKAEQRFDKTRKILFNSNDIYEKGVNEKLQELYHSVSVERQEDIRKDIIINNQVDVNMLNKIYANDQKMMKNKKEIDIYQKSINKAETLINKHKSTEKTYDPKDNSISDTQQIKTKLDKEKIEKLLHKNKEKEVLKKIDDKTIKKDVKLNK